MGTVPTAGFWLSPQQKRVWALRESGKALRATVTFTIDGEVSAAQLAHALGEVSARHEGLRTVYLRQPGMKYPFQAVLDGADPQVESQDVSGLDAAGQREAIHQLFAAHQRADHDDSRAPIVTATLIRLGAAKYAVLLSLPALAADSASVEILAREVTASLKGKPSNAEEPLRYVQFAQWQNDLADGEDENAPKAREFWKSWSEGLANPSLPHESRGDATFSAQTLLRTLDATVVRTLDAVSAELKQPAGNVLLAAWQSLLWRLSGVNAFRTGVVLHFREYQELAGTIGLLAKDVPVPARFDGDYRFREVVEKLSPALETVTEWQEHFVPGTGLEDGQAVGYEFVQLGSAQHLSVLSEAYKLKLLVSRNGDQISLEFQFDGSRLPRVAVERIAEHYLVLLEGALANPEEQVSRLNLLSDAERHQLLAEWNQTAAAYPQDRCFHQLFEAQADKTPERLAVRGAKSALTYCDLNERANQLAHYLVSLGVRPNALIGLCMDRSAELMVAVLGILKAGGAYVPLNPDNPKPRTLQQLGGVEVVITEKALQEQLPSFPGKIVCLDTEHELWAGQPVTNLTTAVNPENLVYVIYTSGSTGVPKGVAVQHRNLVNYASFLARRIDLAKYPDGLQFATVSTIGADLGNTCIYPALLSGGCLHVIPFDVSTDAARLAAYQAEFPIDVLKIVPSHLEALLDSSHSKQVLPRKYLILGGETFTAKLAQIIADLDGTCQVFNHYGPTETTVGSLTLRLADFDWKGAAGGSIPIGRPIANTQVYILDALLQPVPTGVAGELYIAGEGVTSGYLNQPGLTEERFVANPFAGEAGARMYRTGDLARYRLDGNIEFLGRADDQVKIRGYRIELGEIETLLAARIGVKQAVVLAREDSRGEKRLVAYVATDASNSETGEDLRSYLKSQLPDFMVPSAVVVLPKIPLTPNGKIDRQALPDPESVQPRTYVAPANVTEQGVAEIWEQVLRRSPIGTDENFFDLGGHSLLATQVISRVRERYRVELPIRAMFDHPTIAGLASAVEGAAEGAPAQMAPSITRVAREAYRSGRS